MPEFDENKPHKLEDLKSKLFSRNFRPKTEHRDAFSPVLHDDVPDSWDADSGAAGWQSAFFTKTSLFKKIFIISVSFFALSLGYGMYVYFAGSNTVSNDHIEITVTGNNFTAGGEELELIIGIENNNAAALELADLVIEYPKGISENFSIDTERLRESLGTIPAGAVRNENVKLVLFGEQGSVRSIRITLEYRVAGSNAIFVKEKIYNVNINSTPINLSVEGPFSVSPNQSIVLDVKTGLNATRPAEDILVRLDYPPGFQFVKAVPKPSYGDNVWYLGDLAPGAAHGITIEGKMIDVFDGEEKTFHVSSGSQSFADKSVMDVVFNKIRHTIEIRKPFIETAIFINGESKRDYAVNAATPVNVEIRYANNLSTKIDNLVIEAKLSGNAWNRTSVRAVQGHYDSSRNTVVWDGSSKRSLGELAPGESDAVNFTVSPLPLSSSAGTLSDPSISIEVNVSGRQPAEDASVNELRNSASATIRVISDLGFSAKALYYSGLFQNSGPIPPKAETETTYTIVWTVSNNANPISSAQLTSTLPPWVSFTGKISPANEKLSYNSSSRSVVWDIGRIEKGSGTTGTSRSVSFQIALKPSLSHVGSAPDLINESILTGNDDFANVDVRVRKGGLNTRLNSDPAFPANGSIVVQ